MVSVSAWKSGSNTIMHYAGDANISGRIASVGQRVMDSSARAITAEPDQYRRADLLDWRRRAPRRWRLRRLAPCSGRYASCIGIPPRPVPTPGAGQEALAASLNAVAMRVAGELFNEYVPKAQRWVLAGAGLLVLAIFFHWWTNLIARRVAAQLRKGE